MPIIFYSPLHFDSSKREVDVLGLGKFSKRHKDAHVAAFFEWTFSPHGYCPSIEYIVVHQFPILGGFGAFRSCVVASEQSVFELSSMPDIVSVDVG